MRHVDTATTRTGRARRLRRWTAPLVAAAALTVGGLSAPAAATTGGGPAAGTSAASTPAPPTVTSVEPRVAAVGDVVTVQGSGFDPVATGNVVTVGPVRAEVVDATETTLTFVAPRSLSGKVRVRTQHGVNRLTADLFIPPTVFAIADVGSTRRVRLGGSVTAQTTDASPVAIIMVDAQAGQYLSFELSGAGFSGVVGLAGPGQRGELDRASLTAGRTTILAGRAAVSGSYQLLVESQPGGAGDLTVRAALPAVGTEVITLDEAAPVAVDTPRRNAVRYVDLPAGQLVGVDLAGSTFPETSILIFAPDGTPVVRTTASGPEHSDVGQVVTPVAGRYAVVADPPGDATGTALLTVRLLPTPVVALERGVAGVATVTAPGQWVQMTFQGDRGDHVLLELSEVGIDAESTILPPSGAGQTSFFALAAGTDTVWDDEWSDLLPETGTYTITIRPSGPTIGSVTALLRELEDPVGAWTVGDPPETIVVAEPYGNARRTLSLDAGRTSAFTLTDSTFATVQLHVVDQDGMDNVLTLEGPSDTALFGGRFSEAGQYTVVVDPQGPETGQLTLAVADVTG